MLIIRISSLCSQIAEQLKIKINRRRELGSKMRQRSFIKQKDKAIAKVATLLDWHELKYVY